ncbi:MAG TPA: S46 family peptidase [Longimicrobiales bacterium]
MTHISFPRLQRSLALALALAAGACGARAEPETPAPAAAERAEDPLEPSEAARRTADRVTLTGTELGTMWTFENPPLEYWRETYDFEATPQWLDHVRLASVRYGEICSASFVSPEGLVMTNHHCARECIEAVSTEQVDYVVEGFYAATRDEEALCPDLFLDQLVEIGDVTQRVQGATPAGADPTAAARAREAEIEAIQTECEETTDFECQVVELFHGGQYRLYRYRRYQPVKLVFAPELQAGFYGGDLDNFTYPRYALDVAFVRAYQPDGRSPARTPHYFEWDRDGAREGELVFITGNPGSTSRQITLSQLMYEQQYRHPFLIQYLEGQRDFLRWVASMGPEQERQVRDQLFGIENSIKAYSGQFAGLRDTVLVGTKIRWEREFRRRVEADPELRAQYGDAWDEMARIQRDKLYVSPRLNINDWEFLGDPYSQLAGTLVRYIRESARPEAERLEGYRPQEVAQVEQVLRRPTPVNPEVGARTLAIRLDLARRWLPPNDPFIRLAFQPGENPQQAAERLVRSTRVADVAFRESLIQGGPAALQASDDPMIRLAIHMDEMLRQLRPRWDALTAEQALQQQRLARALFAVYGTQLPPDATFTLRISDGIMRRYPYNGTVAPAKTSFWGIYERAYNFDNQMPFTLPESFAERREHVALDTPFDFVTTNDITGGNSGSPMIDREARVVGVAFDSNIEGLPNEFLFRTETGARAVGVHSAGILMALRDIYQAEALVAELLGRR